MDFEKKYKQLISFFHLDDVSDKYPTAGWFEKSIIALRLKGCSYGDIQRHLGMPPKKLIREVLTMWAPELIDNSVPKKLKCTPIYSELYNILCKTGRTAWNVFGESVKCYIEDHKIYYDGDPFQYWSSTEQEQILNEIKRQLK